MTHARTFTAAFLALSITGYSGAQTVRCTTWNLEWFPSGSAKEESAEQQNQRIKEAADVLRPINPEINPQIGFEFDAYPFSLHTCSLLNQAAVVTVTEGVNRSRGFSQKQRAGGSGRR